MTSHLQTYTYAARVGDYSISVHVSMNPADLTWEWRLVDLPPARMGKFRTFEEAKRDGLYAVMSRATTRKNQWGLELDRIEAEILK